jgi:predicted metal-dependent hydrolase
MALPAFWQGVEEFNHQQFYSCHDTLEALWMESPESHKNFYQGILQIAVGCYHLGNHNWRGAVILLGEGSRRLKDYQPIYEGIDVTGLITHSSQLLHRLQQIEPERVAEFVQEMEQTRDLATESSTPVDKIGSRWPKILRLV